MNQLEEAQRIAKEREAIADRNVFHEGTHAFYDTFRNGLIPCVVVVIGRPCYGFYTTPSDSVQIRITESRGAYKEGEIITTSAMNAPPRKMIRRREFDSRIGVLYKYEPKTQSAPDTR